MSISANQLFPVTAAVINTGANGLSFAGNFLTDNAIVPINATQQVLKFTSQAAVAAFFGANSTEAAVATNYFLGYNNSTIKPPYVLYTRYVDVQVNAYMQGNLVTATLSQFQALTSTSITFNVNGIAYAVTGIDLASDMSLSAVAATVLADLISAHSLFADATLTYSSATGSFLFNTGLGTGTDTIAWCTTGTLAGYMGFETTSAPSMTILPGTGYLSQGSAVQTPAENFAAILPITLNWASFTNLFNVDSDNTYAFYQAASAFANSSGYAFVQYSSVSSANELDWNVVLVENDWSNVAPNYSDMFTAAFVMGTGACINYNQSNSVISWSFKQQNGLVPLVTDGITSAALIAADVNFYGQYANQANQYNFYQQGKMTGQFVFIQNFYNQMWLANSLQNALLVLFSNTKIIGYSPQGYTLITNALDGIMQQALNNGTCTIGNTFSQAQIAILTQQAGMDISTELTNNGYYIQIQPVNGDQRAGNTPPPTTVWYTNGGVILTLPITTVFVI